MKKLALILTLVLSTSVFLSAFAGPIVTVKVEIGKKSAGCSRFGWCKGSISVERISNPSTIQFDEKTNNLIWQISSEDMKGKESYIRNNKITFEEDALIDAEILKALKTTKQLIIPAGVFAIEKNDLGYKIIVKQ